MSVTSNTNINDKHCGRIIFNKLLDPIDDIFLSFDPVDTGLNTVIGDDLLNESNEDFITTEDDFAPSGLVVFLTTPYKVLSGGEPGLGLGLLSSLSSGFVNLSGHVASIALDFAGGYGLSGLFKDTAYNGDNGIDAIANSLNPFSITARVSSNNSEYQFLSSTPINELSSFYETNIQQIRFGFSRLLSKFTVDFKIEDTYKRFFESNFNLDILSNYFKVEPRSVQIGISYSGATEFKIRDITISGKEKTDFSTSRLGYHALGTNTIATPLSIFDF